MKPVRSKSPRTKHALEARHAERERWYATTLASIGDAVIATDTAGSVAFMNGVAACLTGWKSDDARGRKLDEVFRLVDSRGGPVTDRLQLAFKTSRAITVASELLSVGGEAAEQRVIDGSIAPIIDNKGKLLGGVMVFRDITERRALEMRLSQSERLASLATTAAGVVHEINNPLAAVVGNVAYAVEATQQLIADLRDVTLRLGLDRDLTPLIETLVEVNAAQQDANLASERLRVVVHDLNKATFSDGPDRAVDRPARDDVR